MNKLALWFVFLVMTTIGFVACSKTETYPTASLADYFPLRSGKYVTYQLDSLVYLAFGTRDTVVSYQVKYETDAPVTDNLGRTGWRIFRYIRKNNTQAWRPDATFMAIPTPTNIEFIENNLRFIKLQLPIAFGVTWKGNTYIDTYSANTPYRYLDNWNYTYDSLHQPAQVGNYNLDSTITVRQRDEVIGNPADPASYSEINFAEEKYARGIGLVYRKFFHQEYQPGNGGYTADGSYGITLTLIDHN